MTRTKIIAIVLVILGLVGFFFLPTVEANSSGQVKFLGRQFTSEDPNCGIGGCRYCVGESSLGGYFLHMEYPINSIQCSINIQLVVATLGSGVVAVAGTTQACSGANLNMNFNNLGGATYITEMSLSTYNGTLPPYYANSIVTNSTSLFYSLEIRAIHFRLPQALLAVTH